MIDLIIKMNELMLQTCDALATENNILKNQRDIAMRQYNEVVKQNQQLQSEIKGGK